MTSSRSVVAVHVLTLLDTERGRPVTSAYIAGSVNTNPGVIRRLLSMLARAGMVRSQLGAGASPPRAFHRVEGAIRAAENRLRGAAVTGEERHPEARPDARGLDVLRQPLRHAGRD